MAVADAMKKHRAFYRPAPQLCQYGVFMLLLILLFLHVY
jgi:hypothetical protein